MNESIARSYQGQPAMPHTGGLMSALAASGVKFEQPGNEGGQSGDGGGGNPGSGGSGGGAGGAAGTGDAGGDPNSAGGSGGSLLSGGQESGGQESGGQEGGTPQPTDDPTRDNAFLAQISDAELRKDPSLKSITSIDDLAKSYVHAQRLVGKDKVPLPRDENDTEAWNDVLKKLGRPEDPNGYELPKPADDAKFNPGEEFETQFKQKAHEAGLTPKQAKDLWSWYVTEVGEAQVTEAQQEAEKNRKEAEAALRREWGNAYSDRLADARRAAKEFGCEDAIAKLEKSGLADDPDVLKLLANAGGTLREDRIGGSAKPAGRTPEQAQEQIRALKADKSFMDAYLNKSNPGHDDAVAKMQDLFKDAYPEQQPTTL